MIDIIITSYNEPKSTLRAVKTFLNQKLNDDFRIIVCDPFPEVLEFLKHKINDDRVIFFLDPGEGKSYALTLLFQEYDSNDKSDIFILTDGDVYVSNNCLEEIKKAFENPEIGGVTGNPVSIDSRKKKFGYWSHLLFAGGNKVRKNLSQEGKFFEFTGYLQAIRKGVILDCPEGTSDDAIIPYLFWKKGYKLKYLEKARVYVKNPSNWEDWVNQKIRNIKAHENIDNITNDFPRMKTFSNEIKSGILFSLNYPQSPKEFLWTMQLYFARLYTYFRAFKEIRQNKKYNDAWRGEHEIKSTHMD